MACVDDEPALLVLHVLSDDEGPGMVDVRRTETADRAKYQGD